MIAALTPLLTTLGPAALLVVMFVVLAETGLLAGFFLPGDSLLFTTGVLTAAGIMHLPLGLVVVAVAAAAIAGDQIGYLVGRRFGPRIFRPGASRWLSPDHVRRAETFFERHGSRSVVLARFVPVVRTLTPVVAGVASMPRRRFAAYNAAGGVAWTAVMIGAGFLLGGVPWVAAHVEFIAVGLVLASILPAVVAWTIRRLRRGSADAFTESDPDEFEAAQAADEPTAVAVA